MATPHHTPHGRGYDTSLNYFDHGNWMWTEAAWGGSYNHRGDIPLPPGDPSHCAWGVERRAEFSPLGPGAGCFLALGSSLGLVGTASPRR